MLHHQIHQEGALNVVVLGQEGPKPKRPLALCHLNKTITLNLVVEEMV
jgi:hypothetical protein